MYMIYCPSILLCYYSASLSLLAHSHSLIYGNVTEWRGQPPRRSIMRRRPWRWRLAAWRQLALPGPETEQQGSVICGRSEISAKRSGRNGERSWHAGLALKGWQPQPVLYCNCMQHACVPFGFRILWCLSPVYQLNMRESLLNPILCSSVYSILFCFLFLSVFYIYMAQEVWREVRVGCLLHSKTGV